MTDQTVKAPVSFGARADDYDRLRPGYPAQAVTGALTALGGEHRPGTALDIGCGTGKLGSVLASLGHEVTGVEPDPRMAAVAADKGLTVEVGPFEAWEPAGRRFDLVACGQAWHWLRPGERTDKAVRCLRPDGRLLLAWNFSTLAPATGAALQRVYAAVLPDGLPTGEGGRASLSEADVDEYAEELRGRGLRKVTMTRAPWEARLTSRQFCRLLATDSRLLALPEPTLRLLLREVAGLLDAEGGSVRLDYTCVIVGARAAG
ncbi:class I SAM-dependent methyltransferase [Actinacidiphila bryophytorum]|uniref:Methyltransferase type 11 n=1 Tax=Actinacidiphila bryophytorum TaxID=1436133 RepID=A0A9W4ED14_9ACTN|nr:methyltransferase domain-containing protein [Actinacidiphila bryophytorum]MBM9438466.1 methyltransferase domain-containing protein [Actinacidiphila bryophytorum]MBN6542541.1 methyltransferase domain-containing protein [Actinacidiphila bryophytorum]CAG7613312.1 Methyltransferase type 11 [Actinacidiphila bryophytorum]